MTNRDCSGTTRREFLGLTAACTGAGFLAPTSQAASPNAGTSAASPVRGNGASEQIRWYTTTESAPWRIQQGARLEVLGSQFIDQNVIVRLDQPQQEIKGFGGAFTEKGWQALQALPAVARAQVLDALFLPGAGTSFNLCRTPIGANDISRGWYSYDEIEGDFDLEHFTIANDLETLVPYIQAARERQPALGLWASPWSPPTWMKTNHYYAMTPARPGQPSNGIRPEQVGHEGQDYFIQDDRYFNAYARYFGRYVQEYAKVGIPISMVMPQNEFNSAQPFPSCCWTPEGLARFISHLGGEMQKLGVDVFFGTLERPNADLLMKVLDDQAARPYIKGVGVQWAGKGALEHIRERVPALPIWASEQECGVGTNDWRYARYSWGVMKRYFANNASVWQYWNMVMPKGGMSGWGWPQNSLITVDTNTGRYRFEHEYYLLRHLSQFVQPGARRLPTDSFFGYENQLVFRNPDGEVVVIVQNDLSEPMPVNFVMGKKQLAVQLPADSFNTLTLSTAALGA
jgi:glucosylceramidase